MNVLEFTQSKSQRKLTLLTCYDYASATMIEDSHIIDAVLVGDSLACVMYGYPNTTMATLDMMRLHTQAVARGLKKTFLISDLPFLSYRRSLTETMNAVAQLVQAGAHAVKLEGAIGNLETIKHIVDSGIPVMGHIGLTPQLLLSLGGHRVQGRNDEAAHALCEQAKQLEQAGCFSIVIEGTPPSVAKRITDSIHIPTIGIGAGPDTDGQILVWHDFLGFFNDFKPKFVKQYLSGHALIKTAIQQFVHEVNTSAFPSREQHCYAEAAA